MTTKILVVEDDPEILDMITIMLELRGFDVVIARDGTDGIDKALNESPDLIVTDLKMPGLGGIEMIRQLRSLVGRPTVPILAITGYEMDLATEAIRSGANRALAKPLDPDLLNVFIKDLLGRPPI